VECVFPRATVVGLDLEQSAADRAHEFEVTVGSQADPDVLESILRRHDDIRLVVDDASHITSLTIASFRYLFPRLPRGSLYIMEDLSRTHTRTGRATTPNGARTGRRFSRTWTSPCSTADRTWTTSCAS
jgi:hypothetical protein